MNEILLYPRHMAWPTDWTAVFGREAPLLLEIGFGGGHFLVDLAQKRPDANVLGAEISIPSIDRAARKTRNLALSNVRLMQVDARFLLQALMPPRALQKVYINFPDPWPKAAHHHRRLINLEFLHLLATRLADGGGVDIATDHADYQTAVTEALEATPYFRSRLDTTYVTEDTTRLRTKYELTALREGRTCHYYKWKKRDGIAIPNPFHPPQEFDMPHVILQTPQTLDQIEASYQSFHADEGDVHVRFTELFRSSTDDKLFVETYVKEPALSQKIGILIRRRENSEYIVMLHEVGFPRPTYGLHFAIGEIAEWILSLNEKGRRVKDNLRVRSGSR